MFIKELLCNFLVRTLQYFFLKIKKNFAHKKLKNHPQKLLRKAQIHFFSLLPRREFMFKNVAYRPTVNGTGVWTM